jgi:hypothetical protein
MKRIIPILLLPLLLSSCFFLEDKPETVDGNISIRLYFTVPSAIDSSVMNPVEDLPVRLYTTDYNLPEMSGITDSNGSVIFEDLPYARYYVEAHAVIRLSEFEEAEVVGARSLNMIADSLTGTTVYTDTLVMEQSKRGLKINEIYTAGPVNNVFYFYDQCCE